MEKTAYNIRPLKSVDCYCFSCSLLTENKYFASVACDDCDERSATNTNTAAAAAVATTTNTTSVGFNNNNYLNLNRA